nr:hypothetical protein [Tanacetum cinerariifolium]
GVVENGKTGGKLSCRVGGKHCAKHSVSKRRSDDGMDHAGSGVADKCTCSSGAISSSICSYSGIDKTDGMSLMSVVIQAVYSAEAAVFEELREILKSQMDLPVVEEEVADEVETQTSPELRTASCDLHELYRSCFPLLLVKNLFHVCFWKISEVILEWCLNSPVNCVSDYFIHCFAHLLSGRLTLGELGLKVRSITDVVIGGITDVSCWIVTDTIDSTSVSTVIFSFSASEGLSLKNRSPKLKSLPRCCRKEKVPVELAGSSRITCSLTVSLRFSYTLG